MNNLDQKIFDYLTQRENFETTVDLVEKFEIVKKEVIKKFWSDVYDAIVENIKLNDSFSEDWEYSSYFFDTCFEITIKHKSDTNDLCRYIFYADLQVETKVKFGVFLDISENTKFDIQYLEDNINYLKDENEWELEVNAEKYSRGLWVIFFNAWRWSNKDFSFQNIKQLVNTQLLEYKKKFIGESFVNSFDEIIQTYIIKTLKLNGIIKEE